MRLELTWPNKDRFLLCPAGESGRPVWVNSDHPAALEVRLSEFLASFGEATSRDPYVDNLLFVGNSLDVLRILTEVPEYRREYRGKVRCIYIDPPFNTGQAFEHYDDWMEHSTWLSFMQAQLPLLRELLTPDGTLWLHLDNTEVHRMRCLLDEVFGADNFLSTVVWQRTSAKSMAQRTMGTMYDNILIYGRSQAAALHTIRTPYSAEYIKSKYCHEDERGRYQLDNLTASSHRPHLDSGMPWGGHDPSSRRRCWAAPIAPLLELGYTAEQLSALTMRQKLDLLNEAGFIEMSKTPGGAPRFKRYLNPDGGVPVGDLWTDIKVINSQALERTGFSTQKPEALLERILTMATDPGDIVLDCFGGSGTTAAVAHKMGRRWIMSEILPETVNTFIRPRLESIVKGEDQGGITQPCGWAGGGSFRVVEVAESMYVATPVGVVLSHAATNGRFSQAVAGQLGFQFQPHAAPLCGARGRMRLAVIDGAVGAEEIAQIVGALDEKERLTIVAKAVLPEAEDALAQLSPGSRVRKAPRDLLTDGARRARRTGAA